MKNATKLQAAWLYAIYFAECERCKNEEELIFTRAFLKRIGGINRWQDKNQKSLESLIGKEFIIVIRRGEGWRSQDFYRLSDKARKELQSTFDAVKIHSWTANYRPSLISTHQILSASGE